MSYSFFELLFGAPIQPSVKKVFFDESKDSRYAGFAAFYDQYIKPKVFEVELVRIECVKEYIFRIRICAAAIILFFAAFVFFFCSSSEDYEYAFKASALVLSVMVIWVNMASRAYEYEIKSKVFSEVFKFFGDFVYTPEGSEGLEGYSKFQIIPDYDRCKTEDMIQGKYNGVDLCFQELQLLQRNNKREGTVFKGTTFIFEFNKKFVGQTIIRKANSKSGSIVHGGFSGLERVKLEDPEFERMFEVYAGDQIEARYLLSVTFMESLKDLGEFFGSDKIEASFCDNQLFIMMDGTKDLFEPGSIFEEINMVKECEMVIQQMYSIFDVVEVLKIDRNRPIIS